MDSLIGKLQADVLNPKSRVSDLLRFVKLASVKLRLTGSISWVEQELSGYKDGPVPDYRKLSSRVMFKNPLHGWCPFTNYEPPPWDWRQPVAQIEALCNQPGESGPSISLSGDLHNSFCRALGFQTEIRLFFVNNQVQAILDGVRNAVLDWSLTLEQAGVVGEGVSFSPQETARAQTVNISIENIGNASGFGLISDVVNNSAHQMATHEVRDAMAAVTALTAQLTAQQAIESLDSHKRAEADAFLNSLSSLVRSEQPNVSAIRKSLTSLRAVFEGAAGNLLAAGVVASIDPILKQLS